jgi:hypothetical protein
MTELADIVAAIYGPEPRFRTLQVTGTEWRNHPRLWPHFSAMYQPEQRCLSALRWRSDPRSR